VSALLTPARAGKVLVAYHGCDPAVFHPRAEAWDGTGPWLHVSRCSVPNAVHKNFTWSCELVAAAVAAGPPLASPARLELLGQGNAAPLVGEYARQNGLGDRIVVSGTLTQPEVADRLRRAAFLLVPSMMEAGCTVIVEAVLSGCVPIVLDAAGSSEVMRRLGLDQLLVRGVPRRFGGASTPVDTVEPDRGRALALLERCLRDPAGTAELMSAAAAAARTHYTLEPTLAALDTGLCRLGVNLV
jgi:glycosyltransferase involved in cell wall biosynthesis